MEGKFILIGQGESIQAIFISQIVRITKSHKSCYLHLAHNDGVIDAKMPFEDLIKVIESKQ